MSDCVRKCGSQCEGFQRVMKEAMNQNRHMPM
jgi:hypothetical protein